MYFLRKYQSGKKIFYALKITEEIKRVDLKSKMFCNAMRFIEMT